MLSATARTILGLIAEGRSYDQILQQHPELTYFDIFAAAREAVERVEVVPVQIAHGPVVSDAPVVVGDTPVNEVVDEQLPPADAGPVEPAPRRVSFVERARATDGRAFTRWSRDEDARLEQLFREGTPRAEIARQLDRHDGAVSRRLEMLGLIAEPERVPSRAHRDGQPAAPGLPPDPTELRGRDEPAGRTPVPGWELFRDRLSDEPGASRHLTPGDQ